MTEICTLIIIILITTVKLNSKTMLVDDFNKGRGRNKLDGMNIVWENKPGRCQIKYIKDTFHTFGGTGRSLQVTYDISVTNTSYCGYALGLNKRDISEFNYLSFWVKGEKGGEFFKVELKCWPANTNENRKVGKSYISDYLDGGVTSQWQKVVIPIDTFGSLIDKKDMWELTITFEHYQSTVNGSPMQGTIYLDDILFGTWKEGSVRFDHFGDKIEINGFGGNSSFADVNGYIKSKIIYTNDCIYPHVLKLDYAVERQDSYAFYYNLFGGGTNGFVAVPFDLSNYDYFSFWAKCESGEIDLKTTWPWKGLKIEMDTDDDPSVSYFTHIALTNNWKKIRIPLSNFKMNGSGPVSIDKSQIAKLVWVLDGFYLNDEDRSNSIYIDNIQFEEQGYRPDREAPMQPALLSFNGEELEDGEELDIMNDLSAVVTTGSNDPSLESVFFEYSMNNGLTWNRIGTDYDTTDEFYSVKWNTLYFSPARRIRVRACAMDASGNVSHAGYTCFINKDVQGEPLINKPLQSILSPNNDGVNDIIIFSGLMEGYRIDIYDREGRLIKTINKQDYWDGKNENNRIVDDGLYVYHIRIKNWKISGTIMVVSDNL